MISHRNIIANVVQYTTYETVGRGRKGVETQAVLGLMPMSHIYGLVTISHCAPFRGDGIIVLPRFNIETYLAAIQRFKIEQLIVVCPTPPRVGSEPDNCIRFPPSSFECCRRRSCVASTILAACVLCILERHRWGRKLYGSYGPSTQSGQSARHTVLLPRC